MKKAGIIITLVLLSYFGIAQDVVNMNQWLVAGPEKLSMPVFYAEEDVDGNTFKESDLLKKYQVTLAGTYPKANDAIALGKNMFSWKVTEIPADSVLFSGIEKNNMVLLTSYINVDRWTKGTINFTANGLFEFYVDDELVKTKSTDDLKSTKVDVKLNIGKHKVLVKLITSDQTLKVNSTFEFADEFAGCNASVTTDPKRMLTINDVLEGQRVSSASISPSGKYVIIDYSDVVTGSGKSKRYSVIYDLVAKKNLLVLRNKNIDNVSWLPRTDKISYSSEFEGKTEIFVYDFINGVETLIAKDIKDISYFVWSPTEDYLIYSVRIPGEKSGDLKRVYEVDDRLPYFRDRSYLYKIETKSGNTIQLTAGKQSTYLNDIRFDGTKILFSSSKIDYTEVPFSKQTLFELDVTTGKLDTIWSDKLNGGSAGYSPDGKKLLVQGGPECFGKLGVKVSEGRIPNSYDGQLYIYDLATKNIEPITKDFDPAVGSVYWNNTNEIYMSVTERDYENLYRYDLKTKKFTKINSNVDVLGNIDYCYSQPLAVYNGTSINTPNKLFLIDLKKGISTLLSFPDQERYSVIDFGKTQDWNFVNKNGTTIYGRIYYPNNYDPSKKYPVIVNYYGGTSPIERSFGGRYPLHTWAANGYIVYVLQPSGATGFGQDFSALHVNGWGFDAIDDIIDGTKKFLAENTSADASNVGCIGASYGGYTTMLLQTRTNIFKTAISHAGISSITSYWGEGYWGYSYNTGAAKYSYPWNRKDIFVENSPIYNADKFQNSILLLHGADDTNVPVGESLQFYAALKLLGKDVEMVLVDGQNHWILDYKKRIQWHYTITSWFDKKLKDQPQQWNDMFPDKKF
ncbi:MAG: hypothetical protein A2W99_00830 [Bacteroidetes bacterium GWF2_33_16]|nr:MAG: hypothetical protein A2X00_03535 [Bacteroidetes bacterium GWE2_32_14]OFY08810.1 MAG: hypothetical protein A2W99_00830 [Bacteroidetes bacterium GWF2_33_16]